MVFAYRKFALQEDTHGLDAIDFCIRSPRPTYRASDLPKGIARAAIQSRVPEYWRNIRGPRGCGDRHRHLWLIVT